MSYRNDKTYCASSRRHGKHHGSFTPSRSGRSDRHGSDRHGSDRYDSHREHSHRGYSSRDSGRYSEYDEYSTRDCNDDYESGHESYRSGRNSGNESDGQSNSNAQGAAANIAALNGQNLAAQPVRQVYVETNYKRKGCADGDCDNDYSWVWFIVIVIIIIIIIAAIAAAAGGNWVGNQAGRFTRGW